MTRCHWDERHLLGRRGIGDPALFTPSVSGPSWSWSRQASVKLPGR